MTIPSLDGTFNLRDLGGLPLTSGGVTRAGVLARSDALGTLTPEGLAQLSASAIGVIVDLRTPAERQMAADRLPADRPFEVVELALLEGAMTGYAEQAMRARAQAQDPDAAAAVLREALSQLPSLGDLYVTMLEHGAATFARIARWVAASTDDAPTAVLVHCTAGKDRTGVAVALLLEAAGVERSAIVDDYTATAGNLAGAWADRMFAMIGAMGLPRTPALETLVAGSPAAAIEQALAWVGTAHGDAAAYLAAGGLTADELALLRARLTA